MKMKNSTYPLPNKHQNDDLVPPPIAITVPNCRHQRRRRGNEELVRMQWTTHRCRTKKIKRTHPNGVLLPTTELARARVIVRRRRKLLEMELRQGDGRRRVPILTQRRQKRRRHRFRVGYRLRRRQQGRRGREGGFPRILIRVYRKRSRVRVGEL